jgi:hypothetical protein
VRGEIYMRLYSMQDVKDYLFLISQYDEATSNVEGAMKKNSRKGQSDSVEQRFYLTQCKMIKDMMDELGVEVPDDKANELGFGEDYEDKNFTAPA